MSNAFDVGEWFASYHIPRSVQRFSIPPPSLLLCLGHSVEAERDCRAFEIWAPGAFVGTGGAETGGRLPGIERVRVAYSLVVFEKGVRVER